MTRNLVGVLLAVVALGACKTGADTPTGPTGVQDGPPSIQGVITSVADDRIRVEADPADGSSEKADVRITAQTEIRDRAGRAAAATTLAVGMRVRVWFRGPVALSFPVQAIAGALVIDSIP
ncbi:MAG TPA: DUF5666 domain-containing protein [Vicinamibacterales bacterium]|nr:DUF5666 domain-containing protein [Vicinamibacterales bacterium]